MNFVSLGVVFALLSLVFAGLLDVVFKRYARKDRSRGMFVVGMGLVWCLLQLGAMAVRGETGSTDVDTLSFGLAAGVLVTLSNLLLIESLTHLEVSLGSTVYRLNTIGVVILSFVFLAEPLGAFKLSGITLGAVAALLLYQRGNLEAPLRSMTLFFWMVVLASALRAGFGVVTKAGLSQGAHGPTMLIIGAGCWVIGGLCYAWFRERRVRVTAKKIGYALLAGVLVFLIVNTLYAALERGDASIVVPIANLSFVVALSISVVMGMERFTARKVVAVFFAGTSIAMLSQVPV